MTIKRILPGECIRGNHRWRAVAADTMGPEFVWRSQSWPLLCISDLWPNILWHKALKISQLIFRIGIYCKGTNVLPGSSLAPCLACSPRARITSTSRLPFRSQRLIWMSPRLGDASACRPTICPGPKPSTKLENSPSGANRRDGTHLNVRQI